MSFSSLRDIFIGRFGVAYCVKSVIFLKSGDHAEEYLLSVHKIVFPDGDEGKSKRWSVYPTVPHTPNVRPIETGSVNLPWDWLTC